MTNDEIIEKLNNALYERDRAQQILCQVVNCLRVNRRNWLKDSETDPQSRGLVIICDRALSLYKSCCHNRPKKRPDK